MCKRFSPTHTSHASSTAGNGKGKEPERANDEEELSVTGEAAGRDWTTFAHPRHLCQRVKFTPQIGPP